MSLSAILVITMAGLLLLLFIPFITIGRKEAKASLEGENDREIISEEIADRKPRKAKHHSLLLSALGSALYWLLCAAAAGFIVLSLSGRILGDGFPLGNESLIVIKSDSMKTIAPENDFLIDRGYDNQFAKGDTLVLNKVSAPAQISQNDVLAYIDRNSGIVFVHRVREIRHTATGTRYLMRGDANNVSDIYMPYFSDIVGKYSGTRIAYLGWVALFIQSDIGISTLVSLAVIYAMYSFYLNMYIAFWDVRKKTVVDLAFATTAQIPGHPFATSRTTAHFTELKDEVENEVNIGAKKRRTS